MPQTLASLITSFILTFLVTPLVIRFFRKRNIVDKPGGRKIHTSNTPSMGGIAIFSGVIGAILIWMPFQVGVEKFKFLYGALFIMFLIGLRDDLIPVKPKVKLAAQVLSSCMIIFLMDVRLTSLYGIFYSGELPYVISILLTLFTFIVITNSYNLIDGLDGLASSIGITCFFVFGIFFFLTEQTYYAMLCFGFIGALIAFLNFNWQPSKIFMGDTGALLIGFALSVVSIQFIDFTYQLDPLSRFKLNSPVGIAIAVIIIPLFDTLRVFIGRALRKKSPFSPDKTHIHHILMRLGFSHANTTLIMVGVNILFIGFAFSLDFLGDPILVPAVILLCVLLSLGLDYTLKSSITRKRRTVKKQFRRD